MSAPQTVEKVAQTQISADDLLPALAALANCAHIHTYDSFICRLAALSCTIFLGLTVYRHTEGADVCLPLCDF